MKIAKLFFIIGISVFGINGFGQANLGNVHHTLKHPGISAPAVGNANPPSVSQKGDGAHGFVPHHSVVLYDSMYNWIWDTNSMAWDYSDKYVDLQYDANLNLVSELYQDYFSSGWVNEYMYVNTYNGNDLVTAYTTLHWNGTSWVYSEQYLYSYDANNNMLTYLVQLSPAGNVWVNSTLATHAYDSHNNETMTANQTWNGSAWVNVSEDSYIYDSNNKNTGHLEQTWTGSAWLNTNYDSVAYNSRGDETINIQETWNGTAWVYNIMDTYSYNSIGYEISDLNQTWNGIAWVNNAYDTLTYLSGFYETSDLYQVWNGASWANNYLDSYFYNSSNKDTLALEQIWNGTAWVNVDRDLYKDNSANLDIYHLYQTWNGTNWINSTGGSNSYNAQNYELSNTGLTYNSMGNKVTYGDSEYFYFHDIVQGVNQVKGESEKVKVYPNPSGGKYHVYCYSNPRAAGKGYLQIKVYNIMGENIKTEILQFSQGDKVLDLSGQPDGIYLYRIVDDGGGLISEGKLVIQE